MKAKRMKKTKKNKKFLKITLILIGIVLIAIIASNVRVEQLNISEENSSPLYEKREVFGMQLKNITIDKEGEIYIFRAQVENTLNEKFEKKSVQIMFIDERNSNMVEYEYVIFDLEKNQVQDIEIRTKQQLDEFYTFKIKENV